MYILATHKLFDFLDMSLGKSLIKSVKNMNNVQNKQQFCSQILCYCSYYQPHCHSLKRCLYDNTKQDVIAWLVARTAAV